MREIYEILKFLSFIIMTLFIIYGIIYALISLANRRIELWNSMYYSSKKKLLPKEDEKKIGEKK